MNDPAVSPSWPSRHACVIVDWGYDGAGPLSENAMNAPGDDYPAREIARHNAPGRSVRRR